MPAITNPSRPGRRAVAVIAIAAVIVHLGGASFAQAQQSAPAAADEGAAGIPPDQLDSLVAPIALYPDPLLAQVLVASTYPLEIIQLQQWLGKNPGLEGDALAEAVAEQPWDPSIQSMAATPDVVTRLADDVQWVTELGNAFLAQQQDVMDAVQRMRKKAQDNGALESNEQQVVETKVVEEKTVIIVESSQPEVIYVPTYSPTVVYGPPVYPYPPIYYPPYTAGGAFVAFSVGVMWGAAVWGGSCCHCGWGHNDINININNNFNRNSNVNVGGGGNWQHDSSHRGGTPYADKATASKYGGSARGDSLSSRQASARQQAGRQPSSTANRAGSTGASNRAASTGAGAASRGSAGTTANRSGGDQIGNRSIPSSSGMGASGFGGSSSGFSGSSARSASSRGASSMGSMGSRGGGRRRR